MACCSSAGLIAVLKKKGLDSVCVLGSCYTSFSLTLFLPPTQFLSLFLSPGSKVCWVEPAESQFVPSGKGMLALTAILRCEHCCSSKRCLCDISLLLCLGRRKIVN